MRLEPVPPPREIFVRGIKVRLDDLTETTRFDAGVSRSVTVKPMGPVEVSSLTDRDAMVVIAGGALTWILFEVEPLSPNGSVTVKRGK